MKTSAPHGPVRSGFWLNRNRPKNFGLPFFGSVGFMPLNRTEPDRKLNGPKTDRTGPKLSIIANQTYKYTEL